MIKLNKNSLVDILSQNSRGSEILNLTTRTLVPMRKKDNPYYDKIWKISNINANINFNYENAVNNQRERENKPRDFSKSTKKQNWYTPIAGSPLLTNNENVYVHYRILKTNSVIYVDESGNTIDPNILSNWMKSNVNNNNQDLEKSIEVKNIKLDNILKIKMRGQEYQLQTS